MKVAGGFVLNRTVVERERLNLCWVARKKGTQADVKRTAETRVRLL